MPTLRKFSQNSLITKENFLVPHLHAEPHHHMSLQTNNAINANNANNVNSSI